MSQYEVKSVVCDYGLYENNSLKHILNNRRNAFLIMAILEKDNTKSTFDSPIFAMKDFEEFLKYYGGNMPSDTPSGNGITREWYKVKAVTEMRNESFLDRNFRVGNIVRHFKGNLYVIKDIAKDSETGKSVVVYETLYTDHVANGSSGKRTWVRPYESFIEKLDKTKYPDATQEYRFEIVEFESVTGGIE